MSTDNKTIQALPTMDDEAVRDFISKGYVILEGVVSDATNRECDALPGGRLNDLLSTHQFIREVILQPDVAGVLRSLLGENFSVPSSAHHHLYEAPHIGQTWHSDGITEPGYGITHLQCFYYPQEVKIEDGPTMVLPGSHHRLVDREAISHYENIRGQVSLVVPAGTIVLNRYGIWHKAGPKTSSTRRGMIKYSYFRSVAPQRDWNTNYDEEPSFYWPRTAYATEVEFYRDSVRCRKTWDWMCGREPWEPDGSKMIRLWATSRPVSEVLSELNG